MDNRQQQRQQQVPGEEGRQVVSEGETSNTNETALVNNEEAQLCEAGDPAAASVPAVHPGPPLQHAFHPQSVPFPHFQPPESPQGIMQFYEARMRDHAAAFASAAAGAAWAAAQMANDAAQFAAGNGPPPVPLQHMMGGGAPPPMIGGQFAGSAMGWDPHHQYPAMMYPPPFRGTATGFGEPPFPSHLHYDPSAEQPFNKQSERHQDRKTRSRDDGPDPRRVQGKVPRVIVPGKNRRRMRSDGDSSSTTSTSSYHRHRRRRRKSDETLVDKTAVAALYEWCSRRQRVPCFVLQPTDEGFQCTVHMEDEDIIRGRGTGSHKAAAKQEAARVALEALCEGVVFDNTMTVVGVESAVEDLAPNLAKQLAIGSASKRSLDATTSVNSDESWTSASGASELARLCFETLQLDTRFEELPTFDYELKPTLKKTKRSDRGRFTCTAKLCSRDQSQEFRADGVAASKKDARHIACAKLLAKLFPNCQTMAQVKSAAETRNSQVRSAKLRAQATWAVYVPQASDPPIPAFLKAAVAQSLEGENLAEAPKLPPVVATAYHQWNRQKQLDTQVESALQRLNEHDDEGRSLPEALTTDDVGRTVLRRAKQDDDAMVVNKLLLSRAETSLVASDCVSVEEPLNDDVYCQLHVWEPSTIVLLLCRAIATYDDPPLGCAVVTLDFDMNRGRVLRVLKMATESHLPDERFVDCLRDFAAYMSSELEKFPRRVAATVMSVQDARGLVRSYLDHDDNTAALGNSGNLHDKRASPLQSVREEGSDESDQSTGKQLSKQGMQPTKRSRFQ